MHAAHPYSKYRFGGYNNYRSRLHTFGGRPVFDSRTLDGFLLFYFVVFACSLFTRAVSSIQYLVPVEKIRVVVFIFLRVYFVFMLKFSF